MLILILIDVQNSQKAIFSFEIGFSCQNYYSSSSHHLVNLPPQQKISDPSSLNTIWKIEYSGVEVLVLAWLTSLKVSVQQLKMCFCLQMLVDFHLMKLMMPEMGFMNSQKVNLCQLHSSPREMWHIFGKLFLSVPLSLTPIVLKNFVGSCSSGLVSSIKNCKL